jgi:hypothetical protein
LKVAHQIRLHHPSPKPPPIVHCHQWHFVQLRSTFHAGYLAVECRQLQCCKMSLCMAPRGTATGLEQ